MKIQVRNSVFETNSSSCHTLCVCTKEEYDAWKEGKLFFDSIEEKMIPERELPWWYEPGETSRYQSYAEYEKYYVKEVGPEKEKICRTFKDTADHDMVVFGFYGHI